MEARNKEKSRKFLWVAIGLVAAFALASILFRGGTGDGLHGATFAARRGPLNITVLEGGSLQALESQEIKCEVKVGYQGTKILKIVEEGYQVTEEDVKTAKVLVELDSSEIQKQLVQQEIQFQSAAASLTDAQQSYEIQLNQNFSDIKAAEQKSRFARMDFDKWLGDTVSEGVIAELGLDKVAAPIASESPPPEALEPEQPKPAVLLAQASLTGTGSPTDPPGDPKIFPIPLPAATPPATASKLPEPEHEAAPDPEVIPEDAREAVVVDFSKFANLEALGDGEAKQKLRKLEDDLQVAKKEQGQAFTTLEGTRRLFERGFVTKTDLQRDEIAESNGRLKVQTAETAQALFLKYEFVKSAEEALSKYSEAVRELIRARKAAVSKLAQAEAKLRSSRAQYNVQLRQRKDLNEQLDKCTITARKPGLVVYGGGRDDGYYGGEERIREGASVRERQAIITIPDMTKMAVNVKIHESYVKKIKKGQEVKITVDAFPDKTLVGAVSRVGVLPDSQNRWMNPDLKVYLTMIAIEGTHDWVKPGMSAKVEILVDRLEDALYVPVQAVVPHEGKQVCYLAGGSKPEQRAVEVGQFNDEFIVIASGLSEGDQVLLRPPGASESSGGSGEDPAQGGDGAKEREPASATPAAAAPTAIKG